MTIGNIPKDIRWKPSCCAQMLIAYIPVTKLKRIGSAATRCRMLNNLFHGCMQLLLGPIASHGFTGLPMMSGDRIWHRCHPILANFIGDYPEQVLVTCTYYGQCPKCEVPCYQLGEYGTFSARDNGNAYKAYGLADGDAHSFHAAYRDIGIKPVFHLFWTSLPLVNIYTSITLDILHQLLQGVMKHLIKWVLDPLIFGPQDINVQCHLIPPNHQVSLFPRGVMIYAQDLQIFYTHPQQTHPPQ